ncbi:MAG: FadR/GntR family transcriptional regulator [Eubacteriales bacterium]|nr:FadR/GntR family transcriptional regulator [Eubacteriales bacterium]
MENSNFQPFEPVSKDLLYLKISDAIFAHIKQNQLKPGDKLPSERDMAKMFQTGRNSVREALRVLENRGLIEVKTGKGAFVKDSANSIDALHIDFIDCSFDDISDLKAAVECYAIRLAIRHATSQEKQELVDIATEMTAMAEQGLYSNTLDHKFHRKILNMSKNKLFSQLVMDIREKHFMRFWEDKQFDQTLWIPSVSSHWRMAEAIQQNDVSTALEAFFEIETYVRKVERSSSDI